MNGQIAHDPVVTAVIIFLNGEKFLSDAISSVLAQTYVSWELMLVDDGSSDRSAAIAREYVERYPEKIRYLHHPGNANRGMSASRNLGIRSGRGKYIALLDCDDLWHPEKLSRQVDLLEKYPEADLVYSATMRWFGWTGKPADAAKDKPRRLGVEPGRVVHPPEMIPHFLRDTGQTPATCSALIRREAIESAGGFDEEFRDLYEDQVFFYKFFLRHAAFVQAGHWDWYRQHLDSCCYVVSDGAGITPLQPAHGRFLEWFQRYLATTGIDDRTINVALKRALRSFHHPVRYRREVALRAACAAARKTLLTRDGARALASWVARKVIPAGIYERLRLRCGRLAHR